MFGVPQCPVRMLARVEARFPGFPQLIGAVLYGGASIGASGPDGLGCVFVGRKLVYGTACRLRV